MHINGHHLSFELSLCALGSLRSTVMAQGPDQHMCHIGVSMPAGVLKCKSAATEQPVPYTTPDVAYRTLAYPGHYTSNTTNKIRYK